MLSSIYPLSTILYVLVTFAGCRAASPSSRGSSFESGPSHPNTSGWNCQFSPSTDCHFDTTIPADSACLVRDYSVSEFIQCANQKPTINNDSQEMPLDAASVLMMAVSIPSCKRCNIGTRLSDYSSRPDQSVRLVNYLCGKLSDSDICCLGLCIGTKLSEHSLKGICKNNDVNLIDNEILTCGRDSGADGDQNDGASEDDESSDTAGQTAAATSSSATVDGTASGTTVGPSVSSNPAAQTSGPLGNPSSNPSGSPTPASSGGSHVFVANVIPSELLIATMTVWIGLMLAGAGTV